MSNNNNRESDDLDEYRRLRLVSEYRRQAWDYLLLYAENDEANNNVANGNAVRSEDREAFLRRLRVTRSNAAAAARAAPGDDSCSQGNNMLEAVQFGGDTNMPSKDGDAQLALSARRYLTRREYGRTTAHPYRLFEDKVARNLPYILKESQFELGPINKIFASQWLNDKQVVFGTKCNQLKVMDIDSGRMVEIQTLESSEESQAASQPCGIHGISINPSGTMLATGATHTNDIGIYKLPTFDPLYVGEGAHSDWVFDLEWIDDEFLITGSRDNNMALWRIDDTPPLPCMCLPNYTHAVKKPLTIKQCEQAQKVRALSINRSRKEMAVLSLNAYFHLWDIETFQQIWSTKLTCGRENVCMAVNEDKCLYAVGSHSFMTLVDTRKRNFTALSSNNRDSRGLIFQGIRSLSFKRDIVTIGTGMGHILFYDVRMTRYLDNPELNSPFQLTVGNGWLKEDDNYRDIFYGAAYPNAIYTHSYDDSGVRLFTAGGPLPAGLWGNYAAMWV